MWLTRSHKQAPFATRRNSAFTASEPEGYNGPWTETIAGTHGASEWGGLFYTTQGESRITGAGVEGSWNDTGAKVQNYMYLYLPPKNKEPAKVESESALPVQTKPREEGGSVAGAGGGAANDNNTAAYQQVSTGEVKGGSGWTNALTHAYVSIYQEKGPEVSFNKTSPTVYDNVTKEYVPNVLYGSGGWLGPHSGGFEVKAKDPGLGINEYRVLGLGVGDLREYLDEDGCYGLNCPAEVNQFYHYDSEMPADGEIDLEAEVTDPFGMYDDIWPQVVKVDATPPHGIKVSGFENGDELPLGEAHLQVEASEGEGSTPSPGIQSITATVDGREVSALATSCPSGPCTAKGEWTLYSRNYATGMHTLIVTATDDAGNVAREEYTFIVHGANPVSAGPGSIDPSTGELSLSASDVSLGGGLEVSRSYRSEHLTAGAQRPVGPQWAISVGGASEGLNILPDGSAVLCSGSGSETIFAYNAKGEFESPTGDSNLVLTAERNTEKQIVGYTLTDAREGTKTKFTLPAGGSEWVPSEVGGPSTETYTYTNVEVEGRKVTEPTKVLAPIPVGVSCSPIKVGCRELIFKYAKATTATGENEKEWGEYKGDLYEIAYIGYYPPSGGLAEIEVADYEYDKQGRLRAEWDPRIEPALKTRYGYDAEGHVTAISPPGQESWVFTYGTSAPGPSPGRLLKVTRAPASTPLWNGKTLSNDAVPQLSGSPRQGNTMGVSHGSWSTESGDEPAVYGYQWEDCNINGKECTPIPGATNENYTVSASDVAHTLVAQVTATNGSGSVSVSTSASSVAGSAEGTEYSLSKEGLPGAITTSPGGNVWYTKSWDYGGTSAIGKVTTSGTITEYELPKESELNSITPGPDGNLWFTDESFYNPPGTAAIGKITTSGDITKYELPKGSDPGSITAGPDGNLWFTEEGANKIGKITTSGIITEYGLPKESYPVDITAGPDGNLWFTDWYNKIGKITTSGAVTEYTLPSESHPRGITAGPDGNLWFTEEKAGKIAKITTSGAITEYALPKYSEPEAITVGPDGNLWYTDESELDLELLDINLEGGEVLTTEIGKITTSGVSTEYLLPTSNFPDGITAGPDGNIWYTDSLFFGEDPKIGKMKIEAAEGEHHAPEPGATIEYYAA